MVTSAKPFPGHLLCPWSCVQISDWLRSDSKSDSGMRLSDLPPVELLCSKNSRDLPMVQKWAYTPVRSVEGLSLNHGEKSITDNKLRMVTTRYLPQSRGIWS